MAEVTITLSKAWLEKFWGRVEIGRQDECWPWLASLNQYGYGQIRVGETVTVAHRIAYQILRGAIPDRLVLDHLCRNRKCCNPFHLEPVSIGENTMRGERHAA